MDRKKFVRNNFRHGQERAFEVCMEGFRDDDTKTMSFVLPTRYGKSDLIRACAFSGKEIDKTVCISYVLSPDQHLRRQMVNKSELKEMAKRYGMCQADALAVHELTKKESDTGSNNEYLISTTIQYFVQNADRLLSQLKEISRRHGDLPFVVFIDESHNLSITNVWGSLVTKIIESNGIVALLTATAIRHDGLDIPGFTSERQDVGKAFKTESRAHPEDAEKVLIDLYEGRNEHVVLQPDYGVTFQDAWNESPSPLCHITRDVIEIDATKHVGLLQTDKKLSELSASDSRQALSKIVRDQTIIAEAAEKLVDQLVCLRKANDRIAAMVFTGKDDDPKNQANRDAIAVKHAIENAATSRDVNFECLIATTSYGEEKIDATLGRFARGKGDILIVKNAGGAGYNCPRIKIILDLSPVRTVASVIQRVFRCATPWEGMEVGVLITFSDVLMSEIWYQFVESQGGQAVCSVWDLVKTYEKEKKESDKPFWTVNGMAVSQYDDTKGNIGDIDVYREVDIWLDETDGVLLQKFTKPQIAEIILKVRNKSSAESIDGPSNDEQIKRAFDKCKSIHKEIVDFIVKRDGTYKDYGPIAKQVWRDAGDEIGCKDRPVEVSDRSVLGRLEIALSRIRMEMGADSV